MKMPVRTWDRNTITHTQAKHLCQELLLFPRGALCSEVNGAQVH